MDKMTTNNCLKLFKKFSQLKKGFWDSTTNINVVEFFSSKT